MREIKLSTERGLRQEGTANTILSCPDTLDETSVMLSLFTVTLQGSLGNVNFLFYKEFTF